MEIEALNELKSITLTENDGLTIFILSGQQLFSLPFLCYGVMTIKLGVNGKRHRVIFYLKLS